MNSTDEESIDSRALVAQAADFAIAESLAATSDFPATHSPVEAPGHAATELPPIEALADDARLELPAMPATTPFNQPPALTSILETTMTTAEDFMAFGQANLEAFMNSGQIWAAGVQDLGKHIADNAQAQLDQTMSTWKAMAGVKSVKEAMEMQTGLVRAAVEAAVSGTGKLTDASMKLSEQTFAPINARLSIAAEKFGHAPA